MVGFELRGRVLLPMRVPLGIRDAPTGVAVPVVTASVSFSARARAGGLSDCELDRFLGLGEELRPVLTCSATMKARQSGISPTMSETAEVGIAEVSDVPAATRVSSVVEIEVACD